MGGLKMKKFNKVFALIGALVMSIIVGTGNVHAAETTGSYSNLTQISTNEMFVQDQDSYYVYFYYDYCPYCNEIKEELNEFAAISGNVYRVDYAVSSNRVNGYNWTAVSEKYNKKIGWVDENGNKLFLPGESEEKYINSTERNMYGKINRYDITVINSSNISQFPGASVGDIYTDIQTPEIDYASVSNPADLTIAGVPTLLHISNGRIDEFYFDSVEIADFLETMK